MTVENATTQKLISSVPASSAAAGLVGGTTQARATFENGMKSATKAAEAVSKANSDAVAFSRGSFEAMTQATQAYLAGVQTFSRLYLGTVQTLTQHAVEGAKLSVASRLCRMPLPFRRSRAVARSSWPRLRVRSCRRLHSRWQRRSTPR